MQRNKAFLPLIALAMLLPVAPGVQAATRIVTNANDSGAGSLRGTIAAASGGDTITFSIAGPVVLTSGELVISKNLTINGPASGIVVERSNAISAVKSRIFRVNSGTVNISRLTIRNGVDFGPADGSGLGAGIFNDGNLTLRNCTISGNTAHGGDGNDTAGGGGIYNTDTLTLVNCTLRDNFVNGDSGGDDAEGGGIFSLGALVLTNCTVANNSVKGHSAGRGGGIISRRPLTMTNCTVSGNSATGGDGSGASGDGGGSDGGGIFNLDELTMTNCTLSGNSATGGSGQEGGSGGNAFGGGIINFGALTMTNCTVSGNSATGGDGSPDSPGGSGGFGVGGGLYQAGASTASVATRNTIIAGNSTFGGSGGGDGGDGGEAGADVWGTVDSQGHNLIGNDSDSDGWVASDLTGTDTAPLKARLGPLANNGGPTNTRLLLPGSPAINAGGGTTPATDQRGYRRTNVIDIGALEFNGLPPRVYRVDALIKKDSEASTAFSANNVYQSIPFATQIERQSVGAGVTAIYQVKVENDTSTARTFGVRAGESLGAGWTIVYKQGATNITTAIKSPAGYKTGVLAPGASEIITIEMTPGGALAAGTHKSTTLRVFLGVANSVTRDAVQAITTVAPSGAGT